MRLLVFGDRYWTDKLYVYQILDFYIAQFLRKDDPLEYVIEGEASGADEFGGDWAEDRGHTILTREPWVKVRPYKWYSAVINSGKERGFPALWNRYGPQAGPIRNTEMFKVGKPTFGVAFHNDIANSKGTKGMMSILSKAGVPYQLMAPDALMKQADVSS